MSSHKKRLWCSFGVLLTGMLVSCNQTKVNPPETMAKVKVGYLPMVSSLTYFVATENGYFTDEHLDVVGTAVKTSDALAQDLIVGHVDIAIELSVVPLLQKSKPEDPQFRIFSTSIIEDGSAFDGVLVKPDSGLASLSALSGKRVAVFPGTTATACFSSVFRKQYPSLEMPILDAAIRPAEQLNALKRGDVDAIHAYEPILTIGQKRFGFLPIFGSIYAAQLSPNPIGVAAVNVNFWQTQPDVTQRFLNAIDKAVVFIEEQPDKARDILAKYTDSEPEICADMQIMPMSTSDNVDVANLDGYIKTLRGLEQFDGDFSAARLVIAEK